MLSVSVCVTVMFAEPFWIALVEKNDENGYAVSKITFGAEPKDQEVYAYLLRSCTRLNFAAVFAEEKADKRAHNPKRLQRQISRQMQMRPVSTKAQAALQAEHEQRKTAVAEQRRLKREEEKIWQFQLHRQKKRAKHRGH